MIFVRDWPNSQKFAGSTKAITSMLTRTSSPWRSTTPLTSGKVVAAEGTKLTTAQGGKVKVHVLKGKVTLIDADKNDRNPVVRVLDINKGNKQIAHAIDRVLRPVDL